LALALLLLLQLLLLPVAPALLHAVEKHQLLLLLLLLLLAWHSGPVGLGLAQTLASAWLAAGQTPEQVTHASQE
jgi:hypothetical protein